MSTSAIDLEQARELAAPSRRRFLGQAVAVGGSLVLGLQLPSAARAAGATEQAPVEPQPNVFIRIAPDNTVTVIAKYLDKGQGIVTGVATLVAEELDADWSQMRYEYAPADFVKFKNNRLGVQGVGSSTSIPDAWDQLRLAGAAARFMLVGAAADQWGVKPDTLVVERGIVKQRSGQRRASFGELATAASMREIPKTVQLKAPSAFKLIGTRVPKKLDSAAKTNGTEVFGLDLRRPDMVFAVMARPPKFGAVLKSVDATAARQVAKVVDVVQTPYGVAVLATNTWSAIRGREALKLEWDESKAESRSTAQMFDDFRALTGQPGTVANKSGDLDAGFAGAAKTLEAEFTFPYLAHAPMEPLNAIVEITPAGATLHTGCQFQTVDQGAVAYELGLKPEQVTVKTTMAGGSFGRRANPSADYVKEAAAVAKASGGKRPVQLVWTRADDLHGGYYRSMFLHKVKAGVDAAGKVVAWDHRIVGHSIAAGTPFEPYMIKDGIDFSSAEGASENTYGVPNFRCDLHSPKKTVPVLWWRSVGHSHTAYAVETMMDELARTAGKDPVAFRLGHLQQQPRMAGVLKLVAEKAKWGRKLPTGTGLGVATHESFGSFLAHVAEVKIDAQGQMKVMRVWCAVDCGIPVNPDLIAAQVEGGVGFALSAILHDAITFKDGIVEQNNFDRYPLLRLSEMPQVEVHIVKSTERPTGMGEPPVPSVGPAVANAYFAAGGKRVRALPFATGMA